MEAPAAKQKELNAKVTEANKALVAANTEVANKAKDKTDAETAKIQKATELDTAKANVESKKTVKETAAKIRLLQIKQLKKNNLKLIS